jgi:hypothetical protein
MFFLKKSRDIIMDNPKKFIRNIKKITDVNIDHELFGIITLNNDFKVINHYELLNETVINMDVAKNIILAIRNIILKEKPEKYVIYHIYPKSSPLCIGFIDIDLAYILYSISRVGDDNSYLIEYMTVQGKKYISLAEWGLVKNFDEFVIEFENYCNSLGIYREIDLGATKIYEYNKSRNSKNFVTV